MVKTTHLTEDELLSFMDREMDQPSASIAQQHLLACVDCEKRLGMMLNGSGAYAAYHDQILKPALQAPIGKWPPIGGALARQRSKQSQMRVSIWWASAAALACLAWITWFYSSPSQPNAQEILSRASAVDEPARGTLLFSSGKYRFARPALLEAGSSEVRFQRVQALFVEANYSWRNPLSARSFAAWRGQLHEKRDFVTAISGEGKHHFYRIRTRTDAGILRSASLLLEANTYHATKASFEFQGQDLMEISEQVEPPPTVPRQAQTVPPPPANVVETVVGPEDELKVFAALDAIGADAEDPIDVKLDTGRHAIVVSGMGMPAERRRRTESALAGLPNTVVRFSPNHLLARNTGTLIPMDSVSEEGGLQFRQTLENRVGGARELQNITDASLEASNALFAQAHSLLVLAQEFPPQIESTLSAADITSLLALRQRRVGAMEYGLKQLTNNLQPILPGFSSAPEPPKLGHWQNGAESLFEAARTLDRQVTRLLTGTSSTNDGEEMLKQLPKDVLRLEASIRAAAQGN